MLKLLTHYYGTGRAGFYAQVTEGAHAKMVNVLIYNLFLFPFRSLNHLGDNFNRTVWAVHLADSATRALVMVILIMWHNNLSSETIKHL